MPSGLQQSVPCCSTRKGKSKDVPISTIRMTNILQPSASKCTQQWSATYTWCSTLIWVDKGFFTSTHGINPQVRIWNISTFPQNPFFLITSIRPPISAGGVHHSDLHFLELYINGIIHSKTACVWLLFHINSVRIILGVPAVVHSYGCVVLHCLTQTRLTTHIYTSFRKE